MGFFFFQNLYTVDTHVMWTFPCSEKFPPLLTNDRDMLLMVATNEEICKVVFSMTPLKALGIDGFHAKFYRSQWETIGGHVLDLISTKPFLF